MADLAPGEWTSHPAPSCFQLAANRMGWRLEETICLGLHAAPFARLRPVLHGGTRVLATLRDGAAVGKLGDWLRANGHAGAEVTVLERLGGPMERMRPLPAPDAGAPVMAAILGRDPGISRASGLPDDLFAHDGQITKRPVRALTLSALAPRAGEHLWDLGAGSGSISVEWCLAGGTASAVHMGTAALRATVSLPTGGLANPVVSVGEGIAALLMTLLSVFLPILAFLLLLPGGLEHGGPPGGVRGGTMALHSPNDPRRFQCALVFSVYSPRHSSRCQP